MSYCWSRFLCGLCQVYLFELKNGKPFTQRERCICLSVQGKKNRQKQKTLLLLQGPVQLSHSSNLCNPLSSRRSARMTEPILFTTVRQWHGCSLASRPRINTPALWEERGRERERMKQKKEVALIPPSVRDHTTNSGTALGENPSWEER